MLYISECYIYIYIYTYIHMFGIFCYILISWLSLFSRFVCILCTFVVHCCYIFATLIFCSKRSFCLCFLMTNSRARRSSSCCCFFLRAFDWE